MSTGDWIEAAKNIVSALAIIVGGVWAYYKFFKGRIFNRRAELTTSASLITTTAPHAIRAKVTLENTGSSEIPLRAKILRASILEAGHVDAKGRPVWDEVATAPVFADHEWLESQEEVADDVVITLPTDLELLRPELVAIRITCLVYGAKSRRFGRKQEGAIRWTDQCVLPISEAGVTRSTDPAEREES
jgi:hypothetical protein